MIKKIALILCVVIVVGVIGAAAYLSLGKETVSLNYADTINSLLAMTDADDPVYLTASFSLADTVNKGISVEYRVVGAIGKKDGKINLFVTRNGMETKYSNLFMKQNGVLYVGMDAFLSLLEDEGIEFVIADSDFSAHKYIELPPFSDDLKNNFTVFKEIYISARTKTIAEMDENRRNETTYIFNGYEYLDVLNEEKESKERFRDTVYNAWMNTMTDTLKTALSNQQQKSTVDVFYRINHTVFSLIESFTSNVAENESISIVEQISGNESNATYEVKVKNYESVTASLEITVSPLTQTVDTSIPAAKIITKDNWMEQLANEIDDSINDNYETSDAWDSFTLGNTTLVLIKHDVDADIAYTFDFNLLGLSQITVTIQTRSAEIHEALAGYYKNINGWNVRHNEMPTEEKNGIFEVYTREESLFPEGYKSAMTSSQLYDMLENKYR